MAEQFKRHIAYKLRIGNILIGKPILDNERFSLLELGDKKIIRINLIANVIEKYDSEGEKRYSFVTLDDGSGQIKVKVFGDDIKLLEKINQGQTILLIGVLRYFNNELYISPEIVKIFPTEYLLVRKLELEKQRTNNTRQQPIEKEKIFAIKDKILKLVKEAESSGGKDVDEIIMNPELRSTSSDIINQEVTKLLEEGIVFEPRPGRLRYLG